MRLHDYWRDLRFAARILRRNPVFSFSVIASLALGIGVNAAVFSLLNTLVFRPLQVHEPRQLVRIGSRQNNGMTMPLPAPVLDHLRHDARLQGVCGFTAGDASVDIGNSSAIVPALSLTGDCFQTLGLHPALGRLLKPEDDRFDAPKVAVLGYGFWKTHLAGDPHVLGNTIKIAGVPFQVVGVTEARFEGLLWGYTMSVSAPISQRTVGTAQDPSGRFYWAETLARVRDGVTERSLEAELKTKWRRWLEAALPPGFKGPNRAEIVSMPPLVSSGATGVDYYFRDHFEQPLLALLAISILVLLVSCANVANLLLARGLERQREIGIRLAIGSPRWHIVRQLLSESFLFLAAGFGAALLLALLASRAAANFFLSALGRSDVSFALAVDWRVLLFMALAAVLAVVVFAILPAWRTSDVDPVTSLKSASRSATGSRAGARRVLLAGQVALALVILVGANVFEQSIKYLRSNALNGSGDAVLDGQLMPVSQVATGSARPESYFSGLLDRIGTLPGVHRASLSSFAPLVSLPYKEDIRRRDRPQQAVLQAPAEFVTDGFLDIMRIPLLQGRDFRRTEMASSQRTAIVSQSAAERLFPEGRVLGRHIQFGTEPETRDLEIVGVVADARLEDPHLRDHGFVLLNLWQLQRVAEWGNLQVQFSGSPAAMASALRKELEKQGRAQFFLLSTLAELRERSLLQDRLLVAIGRIYVVLALVLVALGLLGILLFFVSCREKEIGIRLALGAKSRDIGFLVAREAALLAGVGMIVGLPASYLVMHSLSSLVYGVPSALLGPVASALAILSTLAVLAILAPVYRAGSIRPSRVLRDD